MKAVHLLIFFALSLSGLVAADYDLISNLDAAYTVEADHASVTLTWTVKHTMPNFQRVLVFRGSERVAVLEKDAETWSTSEMSFGAVQYSVVWTWRQGVYDYQTGVLNLGKLSWDAPADPVDGYFIYASEIEEALTGAVAPPEWQYEVASGGAGLVTLKTLFDAGAIKKGVVYYYAAASWSWLLDGDGNQVFDENGEPIRLVSVTTGHALGSCPAATFADVTWSIPVMPGVDVQPVLIW